jgi:hypothetical protein
MKKTISIVFFLLTLSAAAQKLPGIVTKYIIVEPKVVLDSLPIVRGSLRIQRNYLLLLEDEVYTTDYLHATVFFNSHYGDSIKVSYKTIAFNFTKNYLHKDTILIAQESMGRKNPFSFSDDKPAFANPFLEEGLQVNGSLSRGIAFGNNQNLTVNSYLNLQVAGRLNNEINVVAAISDDNNPIQPEGNTQQLQDFDKVFIQLSKDSTKLTMGDFVMEKPAQSYFMNYYKKSRGAQVNTYVKTGVNSYSRFFGEGAVSRGRFARNIINGVEGNLGPYRLSGSNGEQYIIIVSGTEAVYLDGQKLTRGEQNDYIIDYNSGEIVFMPKILITAYSRIVVEFQYSDRNYARSVYHFGNETGMKNVTLRFNYFSEQDNKNQPYQQDLTNEDKLNLANAGDLISAAFTNGAKSVPTFSNSMILYRKTDTLTYTGIYVYAPTAGTDTAFYQVTFSYVGANKGNYVQAATSANGRVYQWVQPSAGIPQGSFEPVILLVSPKRMQMYTAAADIQIKRNTKVTIEVAGSSFDKNTFSTKDKYNDNGWGTRLGFSNQLNLTKKKENNWQIKTEGNYEYVNKYFRYVERYRNVEFNRIWSRQLQNQTEADTSFEEHITRLKTGLYKPGLLNISYQLSNYNRVITFSGLQHLASIQLTFHNNLLKVDAEKLSNLSKVKQPQNLLTRYKADYSRKMRLIITGAKYEMEESSFRDSTKFLQSNSYAYNQWQVYVDNSDTVKVKFHLDYTSRTDYLTKNNEYTISTDGKQVNFKTQFSTNDRNRLLVSIIYRELAIRDTSVTKTQPENSLLSRIEFDFRFLKKVFNSNTYYQVGSGQELVRDFQYIETRPGQGVYAWYDFNNNSVQENNEFVIAPFPNQANFIKVFLPTNTFVRTNTNQFNQTLNIIPSEVWSGKKGIKGIVSRFSNMATMRIDRKIRLVSDLSYLNPFDLKISDSSLVSITSDFRNTFFFNRFDPDFGADYSLSQNKSKNLLTNGFDSRSKMEHQLNFRWNMSTKLTLSNTSIAGLKIYSSQFYKTNNFNYTYYDIKPKITYQFNNNFRVSILYTRYQAKNAVENGNEKALNNEAGGELRYNILEKGVISAKMSYYLVKFTGSTSSPVGFDMLQGLQNGKNAVWNVNFQQRLNNSIQINVIYDGRKSESSNVIHTGRVEARYIF